MITHLCHGGLHLEMFALIVLFHLVFAQCVDSFLGNTHCGSLCFGFNVGFICQARQLRRYSSDGFPVCGPDSLGFAMLLF